MLRIVRAGIYYFTLVFSAGFVLGPIRLLWVAPKVGERTAELMEAPIMLVVAVVAAQWIVRHLAVPSAWPGRLGMGLSALGFMLVAEFALGYWLWNQSISENFANRDPVSGTVYYLLLGVFAAMPLFVARK